MLGVAELVHFTGQANVSDYYKTLDVLVLTSLSEAQPLVILEASCAGVPVVSTDVGACSELLNGGTPEDKALGRSGLLTPIASPAETASAVILLASDPDLREQLARAGRERVRRFYRQEAMYAAYRELYRQHMREPAALVAG
jgi:glycosyltransferase involved in cell wall biosynthesis